ncbi:MAG: methyltransferase domain-containing protein [Xanthomonadales bacterium]|nr:methyltransferase domain-containing protein [Xanthomonadales bacterium]
MNKQTEIQIEESSSWDTYWEGSGDATALTDGGANHPAILHFWDTVFLALKQVYKAPKILDIASGNGAVLERALATYEDVIELTSIDISPAAISNIKRRFPAVTGLVADAAKIPLESASFDAVTSQFGLEYAGKEAIYEAARLVKKDGQLALLLHIEKGSIHEECQQSLDAIQRVQASNFIAAASTMFDAGFKAVRGADRSAYDKAAKELSPALAVLEDIMQEHGQHVAADTIYRLYNDVANIHQRIQHYEPDEILNWLKTLDTELEAYAGRMQSMLNSGFDADSFKGACTGLADMGFTIAQAEELKIPGQNSPMAWQLIATKQ